MKNKQGFTLVELLAVIVIIAIITTIAVPSTISISNKIKTNMYCEKINFIETSAQTYGEDRRDSFTNTFTTSEGVYPSETITVQTLVETGYLKKDQNTSPYIVDPRDKNSTELYNMTLEVYVKYNRIYVSFNSTVKETCGK